MKKAGLFLLLLGLSIASVPAQVTVELAQDQDQFLPGEELPVIVRITNRSGRTLSFGTEENWLTFSVESSEGEIVPKFGEAPVSKQFLLESSKRASQRVDLAPYFSFGLPGRYNVRATMRISGWDRELTSDPKGFNIIQGSKIWEQEFGVPGSGGTNSEPEVRKYMLQQANYIKGQLRLYLRLMDVSGKALRVFPVGQLLSFSRPEPQLDRLSNLHLLYQDGPHSYSYTVFNPDGDLLIRQTYDYIGARPRLSVDEKGGVAVTGGVRRIAQSDVPTTRPTLPEGMPKPLMPPPMPVPEPKPTPKP